MFAFLIRTLELTLSLDCFVNFILTVLPPLTKKDVFIALPAPSAVFPLRLKAFVPAPLAASGDPVTMCRAWPSVTGRGCWAWRGLFGPPVAQRTDSQIQQQHKPPAYSRDECLSEACILQSCWLALAPASPTPESLFPEVQGWGLQPQSRCSLRHLLGRELLCRIGPRCR